VIAVLVASGSCMSAILASCFSACIRVLIVFLDSPFWFMLIAKFIRSWVVFC
jgi:hypothetical protein